MKALVCRTMPAPIWFTGVVGVLKPSVNIYFAVLLLYETSVTTSNGVPPQSFAYQLSISRGGGGGVGGDPDPHPPTP